MIKQNIFIVNFNSLYEILNEIKDKLSFNIKNYASEDIFLKKSDLDFENSLIISESKNKILLEKELDPKIFFNLSLFPIPINRLVELINIQLIKLKFIQYQNLSLSLDLILYFIISSPNFFVIF